MYKISLLLLHFFPCFLFAQDIHTRFEQTKGTQTPTYLENIDWWKKLDKLSPIVSIKEIGPTDAGYPLHLVLVSTDKDFDLASIKRKKEAVLFLNNGIHPGEPDGIDACMVLVRDIVAKKYSLPSNVLLALIPVYNIGGALNRSANYRVDQNGPEEFGFRGNSQNLDLNRDFIKCDSKEAISFTKAFHFLDPDVFVDNHVSNGADFQHVMTLLTTQHNKMGGKMWTYLNNVFEPSLFNSMKKKGWDMVPYVNHSDETPDKGWIQFWDSPTYSSGYATLWNTFAFVPETHMLKPYKQRVESTIDLMKSFIEFTSVHADEIIQLREQTRKEYVSQTNFPIAWKLDQTKKTEINFKGYEPKYKQSEISGQQRLYYDRNQPVEKKVPFYNQYIDSLIIEKPKAYVIPQGWWKVIERLQANDVRMLRLTKDSLIEVEIYKISTYQTSSRAYEGHHLNSRVTVTKQTKNVMFRKGDVYIPLNQKANRFLIEILEPQAEDSYFAWNFFDPILSQKEGFSDYVFEETAVSILKSNPDLQQQSNKKKEEDSSFAKDGRAQLNFIYQNSRYLEPAYLTYPVYRVK